MKKLFALLLILIIASLACARQAAIPTLPTQTEKQRPTLTNTPATDCRDLLYESMPINNTYHLDCLLTHKTNSLEGIF